MQKIANWGLISLAIVLSLAILPQASFGQIPTLNKLNLDNNQSPQCLDFNQDKTCEFIVLVNGTMIENPDRVKQVSQAQSQATSEQTPISEPIPIEGKCLGKINPRTHVCPYVLLNNGTVIDNPNNETLVSVTVDPCAYSVNHVKCGLSDSQATDYHGNKLSTIESEEVVEDEEAGGVEDEGAATDEEAEVSGGQGPADEVNKGGEEQQRRGININWGAICRNPLVDAYLSEPCETLTSPDGYTLTPEGKHVLACLGAGAVAPILGPQAVVAIKSLGPAVGCK